MHSLLLSAGVRVHNSKIIKEGGGTDCSCVLPAVTAYWHTRRTDKADNRLGLFNVKMTRPRMIGSSDGVDEGLSELFRCC